MPQPSAPHTELLYDELDEDNSRIRATCRFTVESRLAAFGLAGASDVGSDPRRWMGGRRSPAGPRRRRLSRSTPQGCVHNSFKGERLCFERIEPTLGTYVQASAETGRRRRQAAPRLHGPSTAPSTPSGSRRLPQGRGVFLIVRSVCAFASGPTSTKTLANLTILITRMNPDLAMDTADQKLLKGGGA